ncbi:MAG: hypothetical protein HY042_08970 [Spirochaetia bacterium]|nr:hypothetical protein [Spirochaetia bacterium]
MFETKELSGLLKHADGMDLTEPDVILVSGTDVDAAESILGSLRVRLHRDIGAFETSVISGETDSTRFEQEVFNIPLFAPYRLILVRQGEEVFKAYNRDGAAARIHEQMRRLPDRTLIIIQYSGKVPAAFEKALGTRLAHFSTRELLPGHVVETIRHLAKKHKLNLSDDALYEIRDRIEPKTGAIELALGRLKESLPVEAHASVLPEHVRDILFPTAGMNHFHFVDALFRGDGRALEREFDRFENNADNVFGLLRLILNRVDEIRRAQAGRSVGMNDDELIKFLGLRGRPPFIQKKTIQRLAGEVNRYTPDKLLLIYDWLVKTQRDFRSIVSGPERQMLVLQEKVAELFG